MAAVHFRTLSTQLLEFRNTLVDSIDKNWIDDFVSFLLKKDNIGSTMMKKVRRVRGLMERYGTSEVSFSIKNYRIPITESIKQKLSKEELAAITTLPLPEGDRTAEVRDFFLLQIYLRGVRVGDLLQATANDFKEGRFVYRSDKTNTNYDMLVVAPAQEIVDKYATLGYLKLFPFWKWLPNPRKSEIENERARIKHKESCTAVINKFLKIIAQMAGIDKNISSHIARHTFAMLADEAIGGNVAMVQQMLGHSNRSTTERYIKSLKQSDEMDQAADVVFKGLL